MPYTTAQDLVNDVLFRAGESQSAGASAFRTKALDYLNRVYRTLCAGASEFLPEGVTVADWWWLRDSAVLTLLPITTAGTVDVTEGDDDIVFSSPPDVSVVDYRIRFDNHPELFKIATHTAMVGDATLDSPYTGESNSAIGYKLMKVEYALSVSVAALISPMIGYRGNCRINGISPEAMDRNFPLPELQPGVPTMFSLEDSQLVRFNFGGRTDGKSMRVEYRFRPTVTDLTDSGSSVPLVPLEYRHVLADMALPYLVRDKNDSRDQSCALSARAALQAMYNENVRRLKRMDLNIGHIFPRQGGRYGSPNLGERPLRTDTGLIIG
jgi:hypothetical protein